MLFPASTRSRDRAGPLLADFVEEVGGDLDDLFFYRSGAQPVQPARSGVERADACEKLHYEAIAEPASSRPLPTIKMKPAIVMPASSIPSLKHGV